MVRVIPAILFIFSTFDLVSAERVEIPLGERQVGFEVHESPVRKEGPILLALHSNEATSIQVAKSLLPRYAGTLIVIDGGGQRRIRLRSNSGRVTVDPNRMFSLAGVTRDLKLFSTYSPAEAKQFAKFGEAVIRTFGIDGSRPVIALHNNSNGNFSIDSYLRGGSEAAATAEVTRGPADPDNFFLVTHPKLYEDLAKLEVNVVLQDNQKAPDDGSLSVYCGRRGFTYVNVEAQHGAEEEQKKMLEMVLRLLGTR